MIWCAGCGQPWRPHPRRPVCPRCGVKDGCAGPLGAWRAQLDGPKRWGQVLRLAFWPPVLAEPDELRRCLACEADAFGPARSCRRCGQETVGLDLAAVVSGRDAAAQRARVLRGPGRAVLVALAVIWLAALGRIAWVSWYSVGPIRPLLSFVLNVAGALLLHLTLVALVRAWRMWRTRPAPDAAPVDPAALERARRELVLPFFERSGLAERGKVASLTRELDLLARALDEARAGVPPERQRAFLLACALGRDLEAYAARLEGDPIEGHARRVEPGADEPLLPSLCEVLARAGAPSGGLAGRLRAAREKVRYEGFKQDLAARQKEA